MILLASYAGKNELEANDDSFGDDLSYSEDKDQYYAPEGWYESSEHHNEYGLIYMGNVNITHWMEKPSKPVEILIKGEE